MNNKTIRKGICSSVAALLIAFAMICAMMLISVQASAAEDDSDETTVSEMQNEISDETSPEENNENSSKSSDSDSNAKISAEKISSDDHLKESSDSFTGVRDGKYYVSGAVKTADKSYYIIFDSYVYSVDKNGNAEKYIKDANKSGSYQQEINKKCYSIAFNTGKVISEFTGVFDGCYYENGTIKTADKPFFKTYSGKLYEVKENGSAALFTGVCSKENVPDSSSMSFYSVGSKYSDAEAYVSGYICSKGTSQTGLYNPIKGEFRTVTNDDTSPYPTAVYSSVYCRDGIQAVSDSDSYSIYNNKVYKVNTKGGAQTYREAAENGGAVIVDSICYAVDEAGNVVSVFTGVYNGKYYNNGALGTASKTYYITYDNKLYKVTTAGAASLFTGTYNNEYYEDGVKSTGGWKEVSGKKYYYDENGMVTGWKKIGSNYYHFASDGVLDTNKIVGDKTNGYYYVDDTGIRISDATVQQAVDFVIAHGGTGTGEDKLKACYNYMYKNFPYSRDYGIPDASNMAEKASMLFTNKKGNCFCFASAYAYVAKVLGYESRSITGRVVASGGGTTPHGWTKIKIGSTWYVYDVELQTQSSTNFYKKTSHPWGATAEYTYELKITNGKVSWVKV